jgi:hypothetical protein
MGRRLDTAKAISMALRGKTPSLPDDEGWHALAAGDLNRAEAAARELLNDDATNAEGEWSVDDRRHMGHTLLGHVCLRRGDVDGAATELIRSAQVEATPVLGSFGPDLGLAWQLLLAGRGDEVAQFAQLFGRFWDGPSSRHLD